MEDPIHRHPDGCPTAPIAQMLMEEESLVATESSASSSSSGAAKPELAVDGTEMAAATGKGKTTDETSSSVAPAKPTMKTLTAMERSIVLSGHKAYGSLVASLKSTQLRLIQHITQGDAHGVWKVLIDTYDRKSLSSRVLLMEQLFGMKLEQRESVPIYVARLDDIVHQLADQNEMVQPSMKLFVLLRGVTCRFPTLITVLKMNEKLTYEEAVQFLRNEEERKGEDELHAEERVYYSHKSSSASSSGRSHLTCFTCGKAGHIKWHCPKNNRKKKCIRCHRIGHDATSCRAISKDGGGDDDDADENAHANYAAKVASTHWGEADEDEEEW